MVNLTEEEVKKTWFLIKLNRVTGLWNKIKTNSNKETLRPEFNKLVKKSPDEHYRLSDHMPKRTANLKGIDKINLRKRPNLNKQESKISLLKMNPNFLLNHVLEETK